jgi:hypothetical protein
MSHLFIKQTMHHHVSMTTHWSIFIYASYQWSIFINWFPPWHLSFSSRTIHIHCSSIINQSITWHQSIKPFASMTQDPTISQIINPLASMKKWYNTCVWTFVLSRNSPSKTSFPFFSLMIYLMNWVVLTTLLYFIFVLVTSRYVWKRLTFLRWPFKLMRDTMSFVHALWPV